MHKSFYIRNKRSEKKQRKYRYRSKRCFQIYDQKKNRENTDIEVNVVLKFTIAEVNMVN